MVVRKLLCILLSLSPSMATEQLTVTSPNPSQELGLGTTSVSTDEGAEEHAYPASEEDRDDGDQDWESVSPRKKLSLEGKTVLPEDITALWEQNQNVTHLNLTRCHLSLETLKTLANSENSQKLVFLNLSGNHLGDPGLEIIANSRNFKKLKTLNFGGNKSTKAGRTKLLESSKDLKLVRPERLRTVEDFKEQKRERSSSRNASPRRRDVGNDS